MTLERYMMEDNLYKILPYVSEEIIRLTFLSADAKDAVDTLVARVKECDSSEDVRKDKVLRTTLTKLINELIVNQESTKKQRLVTRYADYKVDTTLKPRPYREANPLPQ